MFPQITQFSSSASARKEFVLLTRLSPCLRQDSESCICHHLPRVSDPGNKFPVVDNFRVLVCRVSKTENVCKQVGFAIIHVGDCEG